MDARLSQIARYLLTIDNAAAFSPARLAASLLPHMFILDIERDASLRASRLLIRLTGTALDDAFRRPLLGRHVEEFIHGPRGGQVLAAFHRCADTRDPVWMRQVVTIADKMPRFVEGVAVYLESERIYGGLVIGEIAAHAPDAFEQTPLTR